MSAPDNAAWYILRDGRRAGPFTAGEFAQFEEERELRPTDQVWQASMDGWIAYSEYDARQTAARFVSPPGPSSFAERSGLRAITNTLKGAVHSLSKQSAKIRAMSTSARGADAAPPQDAPTSTARSPADPHPVSIHPSSLGTQESILRRPATRLVQRTGGDRPQQSNQDRNGDMPGDTTEHVAEPHRSSPIPRLASEAQAAAHIGLELATFRAWVADGRLPQALPDCGKYDLKAIHLTLDRMSGIVSRDNASNDWSERLTWHKS